MGVLVLEGYLSTMGYLFLGQIQHSPVYHCSAEGCNFGVLAGEDEHILLLRHLVSIPYINIHEVKRQILNWGNIKPVLCTKEINFLT